MQSSLKTLTRLYLVPSASSESQCSQDTTCAELLISFRINKDAPDEVAAYFSHSIENSDTVALTRGRLILVVLLASGDYDSGVPGIRAVITYGLARCGFGDRLIDATRDQAQTGFQNFLDSW